MEIALYDDHHRLPFWGPGGQPDEMFDPKRHGRRKLTFDDKKVLVRKNWIWPVLMGLRAIDMPVMAHVSAFCPCLGKGKWHFPKRIWVQITTLPTEEAPDGLPLIVKDGVKMVEHLWGGDNGTYAPYQLLGKDPVPGEKTPAFWKEFFTTKLREAKAEAMGEAQKKQEEAAATAARYESVPT